MFSLPLADAGHLSHVTNWMILKQKNRRVRDYLLLLFSWNSLKTPRVKFPLLGELDGLHSFAYFSFLTQAAKSTKFYNQISQNLSILYLFLLLCDGRCQPLSQSLWKGDASVSGNGTKETAKMRNPWEYREESVPKNKQIETQTIDNADPPNWFFAYSACVFVCIVAMLRPPEAKTCTRKVLLPHFKRDE